MIHIVVQDVHALRLTAGGVKFTSFVDDLLRGQAYLSGVKQFQLSTNIRTNIADGGVDTRVDQGFPIDPIGLNPTKTIWQYKSTLYAELTERVIREEVNKEYVKACISDGFAYRLAVCDSLTSLAKEEREGWLNSALKEISSEAKEGKLVTAEELCAWANMLPAVTARHFEKGFSGHALRLDSWGKNITDATPYYLENPNWADIEDAIKNSLDFEKSEPDVVLSISGPAGVGKTRFVYESLKKLDGTGSLVLYIDDEERAQNLATYFANNDGVSALLIADECSLSSQEKLRHKLRGHKSRVRVIAIDAGPQDGFGGELLLEKQSLEQVSKILELNFPGVPSDRQRSYAELAGGFVRLAADMCSNDSIIMEGRGFTTGSRGLIQRLSSYLSLRLTDGDREAVQLLALCTKVGYKAEFAHELSDLCNFIGMEPRQVLDAAQRLHDAPGFIGKGGRYLYVTPEIVAQLGFDEAWAKWFSEQEKTQLTRIPPKVLDSFLRRVARSASEEVRRSVGDHFLRWASKLQPSDLWSLNEVERLTVLIETTPQTYLPILRSLIEESTKEVLLGDNNSSFSRSPRRLIVWLCDKLISFNEYFEDAEFILLRLAEAESEPNLGNNATRLWQQIFQIALSGTPIDFSTRLDLLRKRLFSAHWKVALGGLEKMITTRESRMVKEGIIAGRFAPQEWRPKNNAEYHRIFESIVDLLLELSRSDVQHLVDEAFTLTLSKLHQLLRHGFFPKLKEILSFYISDSESRAKIRHSLSQFLYYERQEERKNDENNESIENISVWLDEIGSNELFDRVVEIFGVNYWDRPGALDGEDYTTEVKTLAEELFSNSDELNRALPWLISDKSHSSDQLGYFLGEIDNSLTLFEKMVAINLNAKNVSLLRGYVAGHLRKFPSNASEVIQGLDKLADASPLIGLHASLGSPRLTCALERCIKLIDKNALNLEHLTQFMYLPQDEQLSESEFKQLISWLLIKARKSSEHPTPIALKFIGAYLRRDSEKKSGPVLLDETLQSAVWELLSLDTEQTFASDDGYTWSKLLTELISVDSKKVAFYSALGLTASGVKSEDYAIDLLIKVVEIDVKSVLDELEKVLADPENKYKFVFVKLTRLLEHLPLPEMKHWLMRVDKKVVRAVARQLKAPYIGEDNSAIVPQLTEFVLEEFSDDESVFREFCMSVHSGIIMSGDIAKQRRKDADIARSFISHPSRRIREWAAYEIDSSLADAERWQRDDEEDNLV